MSRRPRAVWLVDSADPAGATVMAARRAAALHADLDSALVALTAPATPVPRGSRLAGLPRLSALEGEAHVARADLVVTTSARALAAAAARLPPRARLLHLLHRRPTTFLAAELFHRRIGSASQVLVPLEVDAAAFAAQVGLDPRQVHVADDFADPEARHSPVPTAQRRPARPRRMLAVGQLPAGTAVRDLVAGFALAGLDGWQLLIAGWGPGLAELSAQVERRRLTGRVLLLGARHDVPMLLSRADYLVRLDDGDVNGLSVLDALAAGVPVAAGASLPAAGRHVRPDIDGWLFQQTDPESLAQDLRQLADPDRLAALRAGASARPVAHPAGGLTAADLAGLRDVVDATLAAPPAGADARARR